MICIFNQEFSLAVQIADTQNMLDQVSSSLISKLKLSGLEALTNLFSQMSAKMDSDGYSRLTTSIVKSLSTSMKGQRLMQFIINHVKGSALQIQLLCTYGFYKEALIIANKAGTKDMYLIIENSAAVMGNSKIVKECEKCIQKLKK